MSRAREQLEAELTAVVEQRRADYHRLKAADNEITRAKLSDARAAYEQALVRLSWLVEHPSGHTWRRAGGLEEEKQTQVFEGSPLQ